MVDKLSFGREWGDEGVSDKLWNVKVLPSTQYFAWCVINNKVAMSDNLQKRNCGGEQKMCIM